MVEFEVRQGNQTVRLQLVRFDRGRSPVVMDIGPVLHLDDVIGTKMAALATRIEPRDLIDIAAALGRYTRQQLIDLGRRADPALTDEEFADAMRRLDRLDDTVFELYGRTRGQMPTSVPGSRTGPECRYRDRPFMSRGNRPMLGQGAA